MLQTWDLEQIMTSFFIPLFGHGIDWVYQAVRFWPIQLVPLSTGVVHGRAWWTDDDSHLSKRNPTVYALGMIFRIKWRLGTLSISLSRYGRFGTETTFNLKRCSWWPPLWHTFLGGWTVSCPISFDWRLLGFVLGEFMPLISISISPFEWHTSLPLLKRTLRIFFSLDMSDFWVFSG